MKRPALVRTIVYLLLFLVLTVAFLAFNLPSDRLAGFVNRKLSARTRGQVTVRGAAIRLPAALVLEGVQVRSGGSDFSVGEIRLRPSLVDLVKGSRRVTGRATGVWGSADFSVGLSGGGWDLGVPRAEVDLAAIAFPEEVPASLTGTLILSGRLSMPDDGTARIAGQGMVEGAGVEVGGDVLRLLNAAPIRLSSLKLAWSAEDNLLTVGENALEGDVSGILRGTVRLVPGDPASSRLDLIVSLKPSTEAKARLEPILSLAGGLRPDGSASFRVRGTVTRPLTSP